MEATGRDTGRSFLVAYNPNRPRTVDLGCVLSIEHTGVVCAVRFSPDGSHITSHHITPFAKSDTLIIRQKLSVRARAPRLIQFTAYKRLASRQLHWIKRKRRVQRDLRLSIHHLRRAARLLGSQNLGQQLAQKGVRKRRVQTRCVERHKLRVAEPKRRKHHAVKCRQQRIKQRREQRPPPPCVIIPPSEYPPLRGETAIPSLCAFPSIATCCTCAKRRKRMRSSLRTPCRGFSSSKSMALSSDVSDAPSSDALPSSESANPCDALASFWPETASYLAAPVVIPCVSSPSQPSCSSGSICTSTSSVTRSSTTICTNAACEAATSLFNSSACRTNHSSTFTGSVQCGHSRPTLRNSIHRRGHNP